jgi:hypothetical protein
VLLPGAPHDPAPIQVAFEEAVRTRDVPAPANDAERVVFRNVYERLVDVDCSGAVLPALAVSWEHREAGRIWTFRLRDAYYSDGEPLRPGDILASWQRTSERAELRRDPLWTWVRPESVRVGSDGMLEVALTRSLGTTPALFAADQLAAWRPADLGGWPAGSGPYRIRVTEEGLALDPNPHHPAPGFSPVQVAFAPGADPRDLFALEVDLLLLRARDQIDYALPLRQYTVTELPWNRVYCLISPFFPGSPAVPDVSPPPPSERRRLLERLRQELATNVAASDARPAASLDGDAPDGIHCPVPEPGPGVDLRARRFIPALTSGENHPVLYYPEGDEDAERIAQRLVALTDREGAAEGGVAEVLPVLPRADVLPVAEAEDVPRLWGRVDEGWLWGCVIPLVRDIPGPCLVEEALFTSGAWMWCHAGGCGGGEGAAPADPRLDGVILTLIATRAHLVTRRGLVGVAVDWEGVPRLAGAGWTGPAS